MTGSLNYNANPERYKICKLNSIRTIPLSGWVLLGAGRNGAWRLTQPWDPSALWTLHPATEEVGSSGAASMFFSYLCPMWLDNHGDREDLWEKQCQEGVLFCRWAPLCCKKVLQLNSSVGDIKSVQAKGSSGEKQTMLVTPWMCPGITQLRKRSDFKVPNKFSPLNLYLRNTVN